MRSKRFVRAGAVGAALLLSAVLAGCGTNKAETGSGSGATASGDADTLTVALAVSTNFDPDVFFELEGGGVTNALYEGLLRYKPGTAEIEAMLAESWEVSPDGLTFTFKLRPEAVFADGTPVDAEAVKASFERKAAVAQTPSYILANVAGYEAVDPTTFVITLSQPVNNFLYMMASPCGSLVSNVAEIDKHVEGDDLGQEWMKTNSAGSGPYTMTDFVPDERIVLTRNDAYWADAPQFEQILLKVVPATSSQRLQVEQGDIDLMQGVSPEAATELEKSDAVTVEEIEGYNMAFYQVNTTRAPFDDEKVRQALVKSIPFDEMVENVWGKWATRSKQMIPAGRLAKGLAVFDPPYEADAFKEATADLDKSEPISLGLIVPDEGQIGARINDYVSEVLRDAGFTVEQAPFQYTEYFGLIGNPDITPNLVFSIQPDDGAHPYNWFSLFLTSDAALNVGGYGLAEADALIAEANAVPAGQDIDEELYGEAGDLLAESAQFIPIADVATRYVHANDLSGLVMHKVLPPAVWLQNLVRK